MRHVECRGGLHRQCRLAWMNLHEGIRYVEQVIESEPKLLGSCPTPAKQLHKFGYNAVLLHIAPAHGRVDAARRDHATLKKMALQVPSRELRSILILQFHS